MPDMIAFGALLVWPVIALVLYMMLPAGRATIWTLLGGYLLLPMSTNFDFPGIPAFDKSSIPNLVALVLAPLMAGKGAFRWPRSTTVNVLMLLYVLLPLGTGLTNGESITIGSITLPGLGFWESLSSCGDNAITLIPFILGAALLNSERGHRDVLMAFALAGLAYSIPILFEIRFSPMLQAKLYGVVQVGNFLQQMRFGGFRAPVFLGHGLLVSTFCAMALMAAIGLARMRIRLFSLPMGIFVAYLALVLVLNKSLSAVLLVLLVAPLLLFLRPRHFLALTLAGALLIVAYPFVRGSGLVPVERVTELIRPISAARAESLQFRLDNEDMLLNRASQKPWFGWGSYGRNRVIVVTSWGKTVDVSVTDGSWIIAIGVDGWLGYIASFGLLTYPFWRIFRLRRRAIPTATVTLIAVHMLNLLDLIPNSSLRPITWLIAGSLAGMTAIGLREASARRQANLGTTPAAAQDPVPQA